MIDDQVRRPGPRSRLDQIAKRACDQAGFRADRIRLLRRFANAVYLIEDEPVIARVATSPGDIARSSRAVAVTSWLAEQGLPVTEPAAIPSGVAQPFVIDADHDIVVTFWRYYPQPSPPPPADVTALATIVRRLHAVTDDSPVPLPSYQPLRSVSLAVEAARVAGHVPTDMLDWLTARIQHLRAEYQTLSFPLGIGLVHGDLHAGNLMHHGRHAMVLGDWDSVCLGPRELDLAPTCTAVRFDLSPAAVDAFSAAYGYHLPEWPHFPTMRAIREVSTLTALLRLAPDDPAAEAELLHRFDALRRGDTSVIWHRQ